MICRLLKSIESGQLPDGLGEMKMDGIVYLSEAGSHRVNFANIFAGLSKLLPDDTLARLDGIYKDPHTSTGDKMRALLDAFPTGHVALLLDNFENLVDPERLHIKDGELSDALNALLISSQHAVNAIITTRIAPRDLALVEPGRQYILSLDEGLESPYAEEVLRELDVNGNAGLKNASDELLNRARVKTRGYPRALEALYAILSVDRYTTLEELLELDLPKEVVEKLVGEAFSRLDPTGQKVMQALAVYNRPVSPTATDYLLQPYLPSIDSALVLNRLVNMHFARREAGKYYLHPADREYALSSIPEAEKETDFTQHDLTLRAADYFAQARKPREEWRKLDDLAAQLAEFDLRCAAGDDDTAASVLTDIDFDYLYLWGHYLLLIDLHLSVKDRIADKNLRMSNFNGLGFSHYSLGRFKESILFYKQGVDAAREAKDRGWEGVFLGNLGNIYGDLGNARKAIEYFQQALTLAREIGDKQNEANWLGNLGGGYSALGDARKAIEYLEQALVIKQNIGDRRGKSIDLGNIAESWLDLNEIQKAVSCYRQAKQISDTISFPVVQQFARWGLAKAYLFQNSFPDARTTIEAALHYDVPQNNHSVTALHGIIALQQKDVNTAHQSFTHAIAQADEILAKTPEYYSALDAKGLALCGLAICEGKQHIPSAIETFLAARKIAPHAGVVKSVLRLFDELVKCDKDEVLKEVRKAAEGKV